MHIMLLVTGCAAFVVSIIGCYKGKKSLQLLGQCAGLTTILFSLTWLVCNLI